VRTLKPSPPKHRKGAALVEFALCATLLMLLLFGVLDIGLALGDRAALGEAARAAARSLSLGSRPSIAMNSAISASGLPLTSANFMLERTTPDAAGNPGAWVTIGTEDGQNDASVGDLVQATVTYDHPLITSLIFSGGALPLTASLAMRRE
jgi:Flp pilus assembly protein TadG